MPTKINPNYTPNDRVYELMANRYGMTKDQAIEFIGHELEEFREYWIETGKTKSNWESTCRRWMYRNYEDKKEAMARNRSYSGLQGNIFDKVLDNLQVPEPTPEPVKRNYRLPDPPQYTETMSASDALDELSKLRRRLNA